MIIDAHTHIGKKTIVASAEDLVRSMDKSKIDKALVFAGKINEQSTETLLRDINDFKGRLYGIGSISPVHYEHESISSQAKLILHSNDFKYINKAFEEELIYGLKFYIGYEHYYPNDPRLKDVYELLIKYDKPAIFHSGDCYNGVCGAKLKYAHPLHFDDLAVDYPELKIVIAHMGYPWVRDAAEVCYKNENVFADLSGFVYGKFTTKDFFNYKDVVSEFVKIAGGTKKLIFGTDWPISNQKSYIHTLKGRFWLNGIFDYIHRDEPISIDESNEIMGLRAAKLFGIV